MIRMRREERRRRRRNLDGLVPVREVQDLRIRNGHGGHLGSGFVFFYNGFITNPFFQFVYYYYFELDQSEAGAKITPTLWAVLGGPMMTSTRVGISVANMLLGILSAPGTMQDSCLTISEDLSSRFL